MKHSESINEISDALSKVQGEIEDATKDSQNPHFKSSFASLASVYEACRKLLAKNGIAVIQSPSTTDNGSVRITTMLAHKSGQYFSDEFDLTPKDKSPQSLGSCVTYGRRYSLMAMVGIAQDDDDGQAASQPQRPQQQQRPQNVQQPAKPQPESPLVSLFRQKGWNAQQAQEFIYNSYGAKSSSELKPEQVSELISTVKECTIEDALKVAHSFRKIRESHNENELRGK